MAVLSQFLTSFSAVLTGLALAPLLSSSTASLAHSAALLAAAFLPEPKPKPKPKPESKPKPEPESVPESKPMQKSEPLVDIIPPSDGEDDDSDDERSFASSHSGGDDDLYSDVIHSDDGSMRALPVPRDSEAGLSVVEVKQWLASQPQLVAEVTHLSAVSTIDTSVTCLELHAKLAGAVRSLCRASAVAAFYYSRPRRGLVPVKTAFRPTKWQLDAGIVGEVMRTRQPVVVDQPMAHPAFDANSDFYGLHDPLPTEASPRAMMFVPVFEHVPSTSGAPPVSRLVGVIYMVHVHERTPFSQLEIADISLLASHIGPIFERIIAKEMSEKKRRVSVSWRSATQTALLMEKVQESEENATALLDVIQHIFSELRPDELIAKIITNARRLLRADGCSVFLKDDEELYAKVFETLGSPNGADSSASPALGGGASTTSAGLVRDGAEIRFPITAGIAGAVASTGKLVNIPDAYADPRFNPEVDKRTGYRTRSILCAPILDQEGKLLGVAQLVNKCPRSSAGGPVPFSASDEHLLAGFAMFCGIALHNATMMERVEQSEQRHKVALELISYHLTANEDEVARLVAATIEDANSQLFAGMDSFEWSPRRLLALDGLDPAASGARQASAMAHVGARASEAVQASFRLVVRMFLDLDLPAQFDIPYEVLCRFVITVCRNYRDEVPYHNWWHALSVAHTFYVMARTMPIARFLLPHEVLSMLVATLCHDIDHRGKNNAFNKAQSSPLAKLYGSSVMERHHFSHTMLLLRHESTNIFSSLDSATYSQVLSHMKHVILATDLERHFPNLAAFKLELLGSDSGCYNVHNDHHRKMLSALIISACDLSASTKPWDIQHPVTMSIFEEFFAQGDEEKATGITPIPMMDREVANIPELELGFIDYVAAPTYTALADLVPELAPLVDGVSSNRQVWDQLHNEGTELHELGDAIEMPTHLPTL
ncbi:cAMP and cAMP-inhibited cGMP 3',5'-cyclic phosphodiesterase 10A [Thecamonas trahens ATCC 50062]|uniref:Phosphodiesterase n=1 Tax=Thecamonas trahens ATCC 50062 TaxID=461836 RepID=A0A0L0DEX8_THETB|nr:cAMP and cAMP-inhibited cGMP 3',5'-cyclic phosphodiesterase 10A [Thecamonas trahens ATCC 50062]KNC50844.1 cAMP and cAMP-inhibited cGMP 3',5'-cyclic phosphodiesterase 10A [Thecamonas trahens ATCC 50062]|eukprot:XP_013756798.1 cAMP and cAMP-inhibited cGMP 3',5'-cyclic phosphodiesterase 10A [Thecamonas trahens ATCC 50062]